MTPEARFWAKVEIGGPEECWPWTASRNVEGYGKLNVSGRTWIASRFAYEHVVGPIPEGLQIDHLCHTRDQECPGGRSCLHRLCVNPAHLEPVTPLENIRRGRQASKTHCRAGHAFDEANTYYRTDQPGRICRECGRLGWHRRKAAA